MKRLIGAKFRGDDELKGVYAHKSKITHADDEELMLFVKKRLFTVRHVKKYSC